MILYICLALWIALLGVVCRRRQRIDKYTRMPVYRATKMHAFLAMAPIVFFIGLRSAGADTHAYISMYQSLPTGADEFFQTLAEGDSEYGFKAFGIFIKTFISSDYHVYLFIIALISGYATVSTLYRFSEDFFVSILLFMLAGTFTYMINGIRQYMAVSMVFMGIRFILDRKMIRYFLLVLVMSTFHTSALIMIPMYFFTTGPAWNRKTVFALVCCILVIFFTSEFTDLLGSALEETKYSGITDKFEEDDGASPLRAVIAAVPPVIAFVNRSKVRQLKNPTMNLCINMSIMGLGISIIAVVTSGIYIGRLPIYFSVCNLILLPWLIRKTCGKYRSLMFAGMILCYGIYFIVENFVLHRYYYLSDVLGLYFR